jgi:hypothetical protein
MDTEEQSARWMCEDITGESFLKPQEGSEKLKREMLGEL